jgi:quercetin dioxygenase-like cupin family protein
VAAPGRVLAAVLAALALAAVAALAVWWLRPAPADQLPRLEARGTLAALPEGPVEVVAETVRLGAGFRERHVHGGPTFNHVMGGRIRLTEEDGTVRELGVGDFFFEPADRPHTIEVLEAARLDVVRLVPQGAEPTTSLEER